MAAVEDDYLVEIWPNLEPYIAINAGDIRIRVSDGEHDSLFHDVSLVEAMLEQLPLYDDDAKPAVASLVRQLNAWLSQAD